MRSPYAWTWGVGLWMVLASLGLIGAETAEPDAAAGTDRTETLTHDGQERTYHLHLPPGFDKTKPMPLVLALHGGGGQGKLFDRHTGSTFSSAADKHGFVVVYPEGIQKQWNDGREVHLQDQADGKRVQDDLGFLSKLIDTIHAAYGTDPRRVYATGISNGGFMSVRLALDLSEKIAAAAPVTAQLADAVKDHTPKQPVSMLFICGTEDPLVPYDGGDVRLFKFGRSRGKILSVNDSVERFTKYNGCAEEGKWQELPDADPSDETRVKVKKYAQGKSGAEVVHLKVEGGGHTWPGGVQYLPEKIIGRVSKDFSATEMIVDFFLKHAKAAEAP